MYFRLIPTALILFATVNAHAQSVRFLQLNLGHAGAVNAVAFAPNGAYFVTASADATVRVWSVADRCLLRVLTGHTGPVRAVAVSPDSQTILSAGDDSRLLGWVPAADFPVFALPLTAPAYCLAIAPNGRQVAVGQADGRLGLWIPGLETARFLPLQPDHKRLTTLAFNTDGTRLLIGDQVGTLRLLTSAGEPLFQNKQAHRGAVRWVGFGADGSPFSGAEDKLLHRWPASLTKWVQSFVHPGWVTGAFFLTDNQLLTACNDGNLRYWNLISGREEITISAGAGTLATVAGQPNGSLLATGGFNQTVGLWDTKTKQAMMQIKGQAVRVTEALNDSTLLLTGPGGRARFLIRAGGLVRVVGPEPNQTVEVINNPYQRGQAILQNGQVRLVLGQDTTALPERHRNGVRAARFGPGGLLFTGGNDGSVLAWDAANRQPLNSFEGTGLPVLLLDFDTTPGEVFIGTTDRFARLWNPATGQITLVNMPPIVSARLGKLSVLGVSADGTLRILDRTTREETHRLTIFGDDENHPDWLLQTADGRYDGSETALRSAYMVQGLQKLPLNPGRRQVGLLRTVLGGE